MRRTTALPRGFSLIELMVALGVFMLVIGAAFLLLNTSQQRFQTESQVFASFQSARLALDQIVRDVSDSGYPPSDFFSVLPAGNLYASTPFAWSPNYPASPCTVGISCAVPTGFDVIVETDIDPQNGNGVEWVRYQLQGTTLFRGVTSKAPGADPAVATEATLLPYVENVMNNAPAAQIAQIKATYPALFPGGAPVPLFTYTYDPPPATNTAPNIRDVNITLIVMALQPDAKTGQLRVVELNGRGHRMNPNK